jgi:ribosomal protein S25
MAKNIGTKHETSLHRDLKFRYAGKDGRIEAEVGGFVADGVSAKGEFIEVQTGSFGPLKKKVHELALLGKVRIVYPVIITKYIEVFDVNGKRKYRRKSPRRGSPWDIFDALVYAPELPLTPGLSIELALVDAVEIRVQDGKGSWRRKGVSIKDRKMVVFHERIIYNKPVDFLRFIPFEKREEFTSSSLEKKAGIGIDVARKVLYVLTRLNVIEKIGKERNTVIYRAILPEKRSKKGNFSK